MHRRTVLSRRSRRLGSAAAALVLASSLLGAAAHAGTSRYSTEIDHGNAAVVGGPMGADSEGTWTFDVELEGQVTDLFVQLFRPDKGRCTGTLLDSAHFVSDTPKGKDRTYLDEGEYDVTLKSPESGTHCPRFIIWGRVGATMTAEVTSPSPLASVIELPAH